jgi:hypothetical protein
MSSLPRTLNPALNPTGFMAAAGAVYAAVVAIYNAANHHGALPAPVILAAVAAISALLARQRVTPVADPVDGAGRALVPRDDSVTTLLSRGIAGAELGALNALRSEAGLPPLSQEAHTVPLEPAGASQVIEDPPAVPEPPTAPVIS